MKQHTNDSLERIAALKGMEKSDFQLVLGVQAYH